MTAGIKLGSDAKLEANYRKKINKFTIETIAVLLMRYGQKCQWQIKLG